MRSNPSSILLVEDDASLRTLLAEELEVDGYRVSCAGIPQELMESEFFGHEAAVFNGAKSVRPGLFAEADGGTLLLDEIGEMPLSLQAKLLRVLQEGTIKPVGADQEGKVDVRIIAATHQDLVSDVEGNKRRAAQILGVNRRTLYRWLDSERDQAND